VQFHWLKNILTKTENLITTNIKVVITLIIVGFIILFTTKKYHVIRKYGRVSVAKVIQSEPAASGAMTYIEFYFRGKKVTAMLDEIFFEDRYIFVKFLPDRPNDVIFIEGENYGKYAPNCILNIPIPYEGWDEIPNCN